MNSSNNIKRTFENSLSETIQLESDGENRFRVNTPFMWDDGDHPVIILKKTDDGWVYYDEGNTVMRVCDDRNIQQQELKDIMSAIKMIHKVEDSEYGLTRPVENNNVAGALFEFIQALLRFNSLSTKQH